jgi:hypothetical protein
MQDMLQARRRGERHSREGTVDRKSAVWGALACLLSAAGLFGNPAFAAGRVALVLGNGAYQQTGQLANPVRDAEAFAEMLETLDFDVILETDVDRRAADQALDRFFRASDGAEVALFFFAGHGIQVGGENFILPVDVSAESEWSLRSTAVDAQRIVSEMERRAAVSIAILDACRDNPLVDAIARNATSRSVAVDRGLGRMRLTGRGAIIAFAAAAGDTAADGSGDHSPFTQALIEEIDEPNVEVGLMFRRVARKVRDETGGDQQPELLVRLVDEVYLNATQVEVATAESAAPPPIVTQPAVDQPEPPAVGGEPERQAIAAAKPSSADMRFFGRRVIHTPPWVSDLKVAEPSGWRSAAPAAVDEAGGSDSFARAQPIPLAAAVKASIVPVGDIDWYRVEVPGRGELRVDVDPSPPELDLYAEVYNSDNVLVGGAQGPAGVGGALLGRFAIAAPGAYWVRMFDGSNNAESNTPFAAKFDFLAADDPYEPNDSPGAAAPIPAKASFKPAIYPRGDYDWFKLWVAEPGLLQLTAHHVPENLDLYVTVLDLNMTNMTGAVGPPRAGGDTVVDAELPTPGIYLIQISDGSNDASNVEPFAFDVAFRPVDDAAEPNNAMSDAVIVPPTGERKAAIFPRGDYDWLALDVDHPGELSLLASHSPENLDVYIQVLNANGQAVLGATGPARRGGDVDSFADLPAPGRYFIQFNDGSNDASSAESFDLALNFVAQPDQYEPNNGPAEAAPLTPGGQVLLNILPRGDSDWFRIEVPAAGELGFVLEEVADNLDLYVTVLNSDQTPLAAPLGPPREGAVTEGYVDLPRPGVYYVAVTDGSNNARSIQPATLTTSFTPIVETTEPDNSFGQAKPLALGTPYWTTILPYGDTDWFVLEATRAGTFVVTVDEVGERFDIYATLFDAEGVGTAPYGPPRQGAVTEAEFSVPGPGLYRLRLEDGSNDQRSAKPFRVQVDFN